mgnify:CR=1 FL=1
MCGLPHHLKAHGYQTFYFTTHDEQFDNVGGFLYGNGIDEVISQKDYPHKEVKSTLGIPDHLLFRHVLEKINQCGSDYPFFACIMTASDHSPYILPDDIPWQPRSKEMTKNFIDELLNLGMEMIICTGGMSVDPDDRTPAAIRDSGAEIVTYGVPVLPGAMFMLAYKNKIPIMGLPGCVMYCSKTIFD